MDRTAFTDEKMVPGDGAKKVFSGKVVSKGRDKKASTEKSAKFDGRFPPGEAGK